MKVFIDTNIFLGFFHFSAGGLEELRKFALLFEQGRLRLILPVQVIDEFRRNRERKINESISTYDRLCPSGGVPLVCEGFAEYQRLTELQRELTQVHRELRKKMLESIEQESLSADHVLKTLFQSATPLPTSDAIVARAEKRVNLGNPPGKRGSLGDAVNWEHLLGSVEDGEDVHLISNDDDWASPLDKTRLHAFLDREWQESKRSSAFFYRGLDVFLRKHFPEIDLAAELMKDALIAELHNAGSFATTHEVIAKLQQCPGFSPAHVNALLDAYFLNDQVKWILADADVMAFLLRITEDPSVVDTRFHSHLREVIPDWGIPF